MNRLTIHIGGHKTGSTSMQIAIHQGRDTLLERGIRLADTGYWGGSHHNIARGLRGLPLHHPDRGTIQDFWSELKSEKGTAERTLVTSEEFEMASAAEASSFIKQVREHGYEPDILYYIRKQTTSITSRYQQQIRMGAALPRFETFFDHALDIPALRYDLTEKQWRAALDSPDIQLGVFEELVQARRLVADFIEKVLESTDTDAIPLHAPIGNVSLGLEEAELARLINRRMRETHNAQPHDMLPLYKANPTFLSSRVETPNIRRKLTAAQLERVKQTHIAGNMSLVERYHLSDKAADILSFKDDTSDEQTAPEFDPQFVDAAMEDLRALGTARSPASV